MNNELLPPADAAALLVAKNVSPAYIWPWLDVESCQLRPVVDAKEEQPCVVTGYVGFGDPISGVLTFDPDKIQAIQAKGKRVICGVSGRGYDIFKVIDRKPCKPDGLLCLFPYNENELINSHFTDDVARHAPRPARPPCQQMEGRLCRHPDPWRTGRLHP